MMPWESVPRRLAQTSIFAHSSACSFGEADGGEDRADEGRELGLADADGILGHDFF